MDAQLNPGDIRQIPALLRGEAATICRWASQSEGLRVAFQIAVIFIGAGLYGAAVGSWRSPLQSFYLTLKLPLILLLTTLGNGLLNGMLAPVLGLNINFRQTLMLQIMSCAIIAAILGAFSPVIFFMIANTPPVDTFRSAYFFTLLLNTALVAFAGIAANAKLLKALNELAGNASIARKVLFAWLAGNLFLGAQISWNLRPFVGSPALEVEFIRDTAFEGTFYEAVFDMIRHFLSL